MLIYFIDSFSHMQGGRIKSFLEYITILVFAAAYLYFHIINCIPLIVILGLAIGGWLVFRPSEWTVEGISGLARALKLSHYFAGVLISLASNLPELIMLSLTIWRGYALGSIEMIDVAVLTVLSSISFNLMLLGAVIIIGCRRIRGFIKVPREALHHEVEAIRFTVVVLLSIFALGTVDVLFSIKKASNIDLFYIPREASALLVVSYMVYLIFMGKGGREESHEHREKEKLRYLAMFIAGIIGIFVGSELLVRSVELIIGESVIEHLGNPVILSGLLMGALAAIPEHGIAIMLAGRGMINVSLGNLIGSVSQIVLLVLGLIGTVMPIPLDEYVLFQLVVTALCMWSLKRSIVDDGKLDLIEGSMLVIVQLFVIILLLRGVI